MIHLITVHAVGLALGLLSAGFLIGLFVGRWQQRKDDKIARDVEEWVRYYQTHPDELEKR